MLDGEEPAGCEARAAAAGSGVRGRHPIGPSVNLSRNEATKITVTKIA